MADDDVVEGTDTSDELIEQLAQLASDKELTLGCAESLTAGTLAARLGAAKGSSDWFRGGIVAYSREVKYGLLEVPEGPVVSESAARTIAESTLPPPGRGHRRRRERSRWARPAGRPPAGHGVLRDDRSGRHPQRGAALRR